jgi:hypothetical protein
MRLNYCDLCGMPIHDERYVMVVLEDKVLEDKSVNFYSTGSIQDVEKKEICTECKVIIDTLFEEKKKALKKLTTEIKRIYELSSPNDKNSKKN